MSTPPSLLRLLLVEGDAASGAAWAQALTQAGFPTDRVRAALEIESALRRTRYACVVIDLDPADSGAERLLAQLRSEHPMQAMLVMTPQDAAAHRIQLLDLGADDCITKPADAGEVAARVRALTRRTMGAEGSAVVLAHGPLQLHTDRRSATWHGTAVPLTNKEFWLLEILVRHKGQVHSRSQLEDTLYGWGDETASNTVEVYVHHLRRKFHRNLVRTVRGVGYQIGPVDELRD